MRIILFLLRKAVQSHLLGFTFDYGVIGETLLVVVKVYFLIEQVF
jgi:hypothetical protein